MSAAIVADEASNGDSAVGSAAYQMRNLSCQIWIAYMDESATTSKQEDNDKKFSRHEEDDGISSYENKNKNKHKLNSGAAVSPTQRSSRKQNIESSTCYSSSSVAAI